MRDCRLCATSTPTSHLDLGRKQAWEEGRALHWHTLAREERHIHDGGELAVFEAECVPRVLLALLIGLVAVDVQLVAVNDCVPALPELQRKRGVSMRVSWTSREVTTVSRRCENDCEHGKANKQEPGEESTRHREKRKLGGVRANTRELRR